MTSVDAPFAENLIKLTQKKYPGWDSFTHQGFVEDEIDYKMQASEIARKLLKEDELDNLFQKEDFNQIKERYIKIGQATNLMFQSVPQAGDLYLLNQDSRHDMEICRALIDLIHGDGNVYSRLNGYFEFVERNGFSFKWTLPTYYLFLYYPNDEIYIKPSITKWFLDFVDSPIGYSNAASENIYKTFRDYAYQLRDEYVNLGAKSMIEIQSLIYVAYRQSPSSPVEPPHTSVDARPEAKIKFGQERWLQDFLFDNWDYIDELKDWEIYQKGNLIGYEYNAGEAGQIDLLARHRTEARWLVVELKRNQTSDKTLGQLQRYMGWVKEKLAQPEEQVSGMIIAASMTEKLRLAIKATNNIIFFRYEIDLRLLGEEKKY